MLNKIPKIHVKSFKTVDMIPGPQDCILPEAGPEGGIRNYQ